MNTHQTVWLIITLINAVTFGMNFAQVINRSATRSTYVWLSVTAILIGSGILRIEGVL